MFVPQPPVCWHCCEVRGAQGSVWTCADSVSSLYVYVLLGGGLLPDTFELVLLQDREPRGLCSLDMYIYMKEQTHRQDIRVSEP